MDLTVQQGTLIRRVLTDWTVSYFHMKERVTKTLDVQRREWTPTAAPYFDSLESLGSTR